MTDNNEHKIEIMYQLDESFREIRSAINTYWSKYSVHGIGITHGRLLSTLANEGARKASYLADRLHITCGAVTGIADKLIEHGLVVRLKDDSDRRVVLLSLTELGAKRAEEIKMIRKNLMLNMFASLSEEEMEQGLQLFTKIKSNLFDYLDSEEE
ncbi:MULTISPECIES: MarR family winged helix-turn-helix transcriptional regulator [Paenibacillus]|uniref:MarR family winged helix-turn-helix transcriptional regulator n=1 Tax=Paenibacillus TaxID=44249 RepID=UPI00203FDDBC|nr:MarR family transcriptional regulator [Paenibacillus camelliae]MCM3632379.1 MarR family transcriptional regulator [Paenibacillus camelliae]